MSEWSDNINAKLDILAQALKDRDAKIKTLETVVNLVGEMINEGQLRVIADTLPGITRKVALQQALSMAGEMYELEAKKK